DRDVAAVRQNGRKSFQHSIGAADDRVVELRIRLVEPTGESDPARNGINFGDDVAVVGQDQVWSNDAWQIISDFFASRKLDQLFWFAGVEIARHPFRLFAFNTKLVKLIASALKNKKSMA